MEDNDEMTRLEERHMRFGVNSSGLLGKVLTFATGAGRCANGRQADASSTAK
jgi:hypothetical protein